ncbi:hypothetical protein DFH06DRAFT_1327196 [Mycena polygramma]|nr:hypothetical protein DFH06DRAFT_1327196 [Mycena polygramma]
MHDCLRIAQVVDMTCSQLAVSSDRRDQRALAALARTCTTFKDPALDYLWKSATLAQLLTSCMPSDLWTVDSTVVAAQDIGEPTTPALRLLRPICDSDWQRVRLYAPRIKKLTSGRDAWDLQSIFPNLSLAFPQSLLHNLQDLEWHHHDWVFHYIHIFLRPSLTRIAFDVTSKWDCSLFSRLGDRCPKLANISIAAEPGVDLQPLSRFVACLSRAETIYVPWLEQDALKHLSTLATLKSLHMDRLPEALRSVARTAPAFPALRHLSLDDAMLVDMTQFLRMGLDVPLESVSLSRDSCPSAGDMHGFLTAVATRVSHSTLTRLRLDGGGGCSSYKPNPGIYPVQPDTLVLLLCFKDLTCLHLTSALGFDLDDDTVSRMARAWPRIESLSLAGSTPSTIRPRTTLASLYSIARHCPHIFALTMAFDGSDIPSPSAHRRIVVRNESLRQMNVLHSPITTAIAMQQFLLGVFPNLDRITTRRRYGQ